MSMVSTLTPEQKSVSGESYGDGIAGVLPEESVSRGEPDLPETRLKLRERREPAGMVSNDK